MDLRVGGKFKLIKKCGSGAFGEIYQGKYCEWAFIGSEGVGDGWHLTNSKLTTIFFLKAQMSRLEMTLRSNW